MAGQSSVFKSFYKRKETHNSNYLACKNILETILNNQFNVKFFNATSTEIFGNKNKKLRIDGNKNPVSPYGIAKLKSFNLAKNYREKFNLYTYNGILSNCESFLRPKNFVLPKICISALIAKQNYENGIISKFMFGNINIIRDWGWAEEYVKTIWLNVQKNPCDFFVATGKSFCLKKLIYLAFKKLNLDWKNHIIISKKNFRKKEIRSVKVHLNNEQKYKNKINGKDIIYKLLKYYSKLECK